MGAWTAAFYSRVYDLNGTEYGVPLAIIVLTGGGGGSLVGGYVADRLATFAPPAKAYMIGMRCLGVGGGMGDKMGFVCLPARGRRGSAQKGSCG